MEAEDPTAAVSPLGPVSSFGSAPILGSHQRWALKSLREYGPPGSSGVLLTQTSGPMEAKRGALEFMAIPVSRDNHENFSGEGKDLTEESYPPPEGRPSQSSPQTGTSEEKDTDGSGGKDLFSNNSQVKGSTSSEDQTVLLQTTVKWKLVDLPAGPTRPSPSGASISEPKHTDSDSTAAEARGEILYVRRPTEKSVNNPFSKVQVPLVTRKQSLNAPGTVTQIHFVATTPELTPEVSSAVEETASSRSMTAVNHPIPTTDATTAGDITFSQDSTMSFTWLPVVQEETHEPQTHLPTTAVTNVRFEITSNTPQLITPYREETSHQAESRSGVSESFVVGHGWRTSGQDSLATKSQPSPTTESVGGDNSSEAVDHSVSIPPGESLLFRHPYVLCELVPMCVTVL